MFSSNNAAVAGQRLPTNVDVSSWFVDVPDLDPDWAERNPDRAMAWLFVTPRPCEALERLLRI